VLSVHRRRLFTFPSGIMRVVIEPTHKGFAVLVPSSKPLKIAANSVECNPEIGSFLYGFSPYWQPFGNLKVWVL
jgi:hypothetical protein